MDLTEELLPLARDILKEKIAAQKRLWLSNMLDYQMAEQMESEGKMDSDTVERLRQGMEDSQAVLERWQNRAKEIEQAMSMDVSKLLGRNT